MSYHSKISKLQQVPDFVITIPLTIATLAICSLCGLAVWLPQSMNNQRLQEFAEGLYSYPLPVETEVIDRTASVSLMGNGNHCDFMATQSLASNLSREEIEAFYQDAGIPVVSKKSLYNQRGLVPIRLEFVAPSSSDGTVHFTIIAIDPGYPADFDIRCH